MSLRAKLLALFVLLGVAPIVALGAFNYVRSIKAVEDLIAERTASIAQRAAEEVADRYALRQSDLLLFAENAETQRLYRAHTVGDTVQERAALALADRYLRDAWAVLNPSYRWVEFQDKRGAVLYTLGVDRGARAAEAETGGSQLLDFILIDQPIHDVDDARELGTLLAAVRVRALLPTEALAAAFGRAGYSVIIDRSDGYVLYHPSRAYLRQATAALLGADGWNLDASAFDAGSGRFSYEEDGSARIASFVSLTSPEWIVVSSASLDEFAPPFARTRLINLAVVLAAAAAVAAAFLVTTRRMTRSLADLTTAADEVASGNFSPRLPPAGSDEVGKLSTAFGLMVREVQEMLRRVRESRHMAVIGQFASQLSHEIRNPLTSIKLNLQSLERDVAAKRIPEDSARPVDICLREVTRLDRVVRGVLSVARTRSAVREKGSVHDAVQEALEVLRPQLEAQGVAVVRDLSAARDVVLCDAEQLKGVFLNLFLNGAEAMPQGGTLRVSTETAADCEAEGKQVIRVRVADEGRGVPVELREKIFEPFFTTKGEGTGFGLTLAQHAVEEHEGVLRLEDGGESAGAVFAVELPLAETESES